MLLSVFGTPSALMCGGLNVVRNLVELGIGPHSLVYANSTDELRKALSELVAEQGARVVLCSDFPDADLCALLISARAPVVLFVDGFDDLVNYVCKTHDMSLANSIRTCSRSICALEPLIRSNDVLKFDSRAYRLSMKDVLPVMARYFDIALPDAKVDQIISVLLKERSAQSSLSDYLLATFPHATLPGMAIRKLPADDRQMLSQLSAAYSALAAGRHFEKMDWPVGLFLNLDYPDAPFPGRIELLGPARFIAYGPYLHLTAGRWRANIAFEVAHNYSGNQLYVDAVSGEILSVVTTRLPVEGTFNFQIDFEIKNPARPVELRFQILSGAIEGVFTLNSASLVRLTEANAAISEAS